MNYSRELVEALAQLGMLLIILAPLVLLWLRRLSHWRWIAVGLATVELLLLAVILYWGEARYFGERRLFVAAARACAAEVEAGRGSELSHRLAELIADPGFLRDREQSARRFYQCVTGVSAPELAELPARSYWLVTALVWLFLVGVLYTLRRREQGFGRVAVTLCALLWLGCWLMWIRAEVRNGYMPSYMGFDLSGIQAELRRDRFAPERLNVLKELDPDSGKLGFAAGWTRE